MIIDRPHLEVSGVSSSMAELGALFEPLDVGGARLANRIMCSALSLQYGEQHLISERYIAYCRERARGGVGLVISEQFVASPISGSHRNNFIAALRRGPGRAFRRALPALAPYETRFFAHLFVCGAVGSSMMGLDWRPVRGPSRVAVPGGETPLPLEAAEIGELARDFARSASHAKAGGLDGVEVQGAHGWLIGQFLSLYYNRREDEYGGSVENRCRVAIEIGRAVRDEVGSSFPVGLSLSYDELLGEAGITPQDTLDQLTVLIGANVFDFFDLSIGSPHSGHHTVASMAVAEGVPLEFAARARAHVGGAAAIFVSGRIVDPIMAADAVATGKADVVAMSRAHLADPHLVRKVREGRLGEITRCVGANMCTGRGAINQPVICALNPRTGRELEWPELEPTARRRSVLVAGAGPAGLRAAAVAAARGHDVVLHEAREQPGGHLFDIAWLPTRSAWLRAIEDLVALLERMGGTLALGSEVDAEKVAAASPDVVVVATGSSWDDSIAESTRPDGTGVRVRGLDRALAEARDDPAHLGRSVLIVDESGTYAPLGLAEALARAGARVHVATPHSAIGDEAALRLELPHLLPRVRALGVELFTSRDLGTIDHGEVELRDTWGGPATVLTGIDSIVLAARRLPRDRLYRQLANRPHNTDLRLIGDALAPRPTPAAVHDGERCAREL